MSIYLVTPHAIRECTSVQAAIGKALGAERAAQASHGAQAGADCYVVTGGSDLSFRGLVVGRKLIGGRGGMGRRLAQFGCADHVVARVREAIATGTVR